MKQRYIDQIHPKDQTVIKKGESGEDIAKSIIGGLTDKGK